MMAKDLMKMLGEGLVLGDGGMFLEANWRGYDVPGMISTHPEALQQIHKDFYNVGSQVLQALTWFTSSAQLEARYGWKNRMEEINRTAIQAAKQACNGAAPVGGCLVSTMTGSWLGESVFVPGDASSYERAQAEWEEQIAILVDAGADFLIPETFFRLDEVRLCLQSCKKTALPTMVLLGIGSDKTTQDGATAAECARVLAAEGADVVGTVCIGDPEQMLPTALEMQAAVDVPIACQPKGFEQKVDTEERGYTASRFEKSVAPEGMAAFALQAKAEGINYIGGCCATGPAHIRAMAEALGMRGDE
jgi:methionine synthase I (cobalamin-dependent)